MSEIEPMNISERRKYLHKMRIRYMKLEDRVDKTHLVTEMALVTGLHRKSILRLIHGELARRPRRRQRGVSYGPEVVDAIRKIARSLDYPCAERLQPNLAWLAEELVRHGELVLTEPLREKLRGISLSTVRRMVPPELSQRERIAYREGRRAAPRAGLAAIPMKRIPNEEAKPGHFEVDLVHHCGGSSTGQYLHTLQITDVATGWCEPVALLGRSQMVMQDGFEHIWHRLPFPVLELHPDNGSEFLNVMILRLWKHHHPQAQISRSHPFRKNDNRFVEENNGSLVRAYVGYQRLDTVAHTRLLNQIYDHLWLHHNFFQPVMRLKEKVPGDANRRTRRIYDTPAPPLDRLCAAGVLDPAQQQALHTLRQRTNPAALRREIDILLDRLFSLSPAAEGVTEDVRQTLNLWRSGQKNTAHFSTGTTAPATVP